MKKALTFVFLLLAFCVGAQKHDSIYFKYDTVKIPLIIEQNSQIRNQRISELKKEFEVLERQNKDDYTAILQFNSIDEKRIVGQPKYISGKLVFKLKLK